MFRSLDFARDDKCLSFEMIGVISTERSEWRNLNIDIIISPDGAFKKVPTGVTK